MKVVPFLLIALGILGSETVAAQEGIRFGGETAFLQIGQSEEAVLASLRRSFIVAPIGSIVASGTTLSPSKATPSIVRDRSTWLVYQKGDPSYLRGSITFAENKLESASKDWLLPELPGTSSDVVAAI